MTDHDSRHDRPACSRRQFVDWVLGAGAGGFTLAVAYPVASFLVPPPAPESDVSMVVLSTREDEVRPNSGLLFRFGDRPGILVRAPNGELRAFSARCTHLDCTVQFREDLGHIWCACHNGHFDLNGRNIAGPPPSPLDAFAVRVRDGEIYVSLAD